MSDRILGPHDPSLYYHNALIKPPAAQSKRVLRVVVDSRERNISMFPNPNQYEINVIEDIQNVETLSLVSAEFPFDAYTVGINSNTLVLAYDDALLKITVDYGNYTAADLATELQNTLNTVVGVDDFVVTYNTKKDNFVFRCKNPFGLVFTGNQFKHPYNSTFDFAPIEKSIGKVIGFGIKNYRSVPQSTNDAFINVINSEFKKDFSGTDYIVLKIDSFDLNKSTADSIQNSFAIITKTIRGNPYAMEFINKQFKPFLGKLTKIKVSLVDYNNVPYDFQNKDHRFELLLLCDF